MQQPSTKTAATSTTPSTSSPGGSTEGIDVETKSGSEVTTGLILLVSGVGVGFCSVFLYGFVINYYRFLRSVYRPLLPASQ